MATKYDGKTAEGFHWYYLRDKQGNRRKAKNGRDYLKSYVWRYRDSEGKAKQVTGRTLEEIRAKRTEIQHSLQTGVYIDPKRGQITVKEYADQWLKAVTPALAQRSVEQYGGHIRNHITPELGHYRLKALDAEALQGFVTYLSGKGTNATVGAVWKTLSSILKDAVAKGRIPRDPRTGVVVPKTATKRGYPLAWDIIEAIEAKMADRYRIIATLAAETGMRQSECAGLCADQIDWGKKTIRVDRQLSRPKTGETAVLKDLKTTKGERDLPLSDHLCAALKRYLEDHPATARQMTRVYRDRSRKTISVRLLFTHDDGSPVTARDIQREWDKARTKAGHPKDVHGSANFHRLRHTYACELINGGMDAKAVMTMLGHANITTTFDTYGHMLDRSHDRVRDIVNAMRTRPRGTLRAVA